MKRAPFYFVFDVESVGLHGEPFAVGWTVRDGLNGEELFAERLTIDFELVAKHEHNGRRHLDSDIAWVRAHVLPALALSSFEPLLSAGAMLRAFWSDWKQWESRGAVMAADVPWPVEARFLMECACWVHYDRGNSRPTIQAGPYPLLDIASIRFAAGFDPLATEPRISAAELPVHDPLADARQSARLLFEAFEWLDAR